MTGYYLVLSMLAVAFIGALIVFTKEAQEDAIAAPDNKTPPDVMRWLNLSAESTAESETDWKKLILNSLSRETVELVNLSTEGAKAADLDRQITRYSGNRVFDIVTVWAGPEDLLAGSDLETFEVTLSEILRKANSPDTVFVLANIPDLTAELVAAQLAKHDAVKAVIEQWNSSIARLTAAFNGTLANLYEPAGQSASTMHWLRGTTFSPDDVAQQEVARRFAVAMTDAVDKQMTLTHPRTNS